MASRTARTAIQAGAILVIGVLLGGCSGPVVEKQPCPSLSYAKGVVYRLGNPAALGEATAGNLAAAAEEPKFVGHPFVLPPGGGVTVTATLSGSDIPKTASLYVYGPRDGSGLFGACTAEVVGASVTIEVPEDQRGEWLVLVGADPIANATYEYELTVTCEGDGCDADACPSLLATCQIEVCAGGFPTAEVGELTCPTCACESAECGAFQTRVFDECVCDCEVPLNPAPVCGADGVTYTTACFAECAQVAVADTTGACEDVCPALDGCTLECTTGLAIVDGCETCACAGGCTDVGGPWRPVCATDGLTYPSRERMACETDGVEVAYLGPCLPYCPPAEDCQLSCEFGLVPAALGTGSCFDCSCAGQAPADRPLQCAILKGAPQVVEGDPAATASARLSSVRTFPDANTAQAAGFRPAIADACPPSLCAGDADCSGAKDAFERDITQLFGDGITGKVGCLQLGKTLARACRVLPNEELENNTGGCDCLDRPGSNVYDPVCASFASSSSGETAPRTFFNVCTATCLGAWPLGYPGECCAERLDLTARRARYDELVVFCKASGADRVPRPFTETACPPTIATCEASTDPNLCCTAFTSKPPGPPGGGP